MTFLKKFGALIVKMTAIVAGVAPIVATTDKSNALVTTVSADLAQIGQVITSVEAVGQAVSPNMKGADKLIAAAPQVAQVILQSTLLAGHKIGKPELFAQGSKKIADGMADVLNSLKDDGVQSENKA
jgi:hypothetical protein